MARSKPTAADRLRRNLESGKGAVDQIEREAFLNGVGTAVTTMESAVLAGEDPIVVLSQMVNALPARQIR